MSKWLLSVPVLFGLESLAAREIRALGYETHQVEDRRVSFYGDETAICRANIWLRTAERVQIKLGEFTALSFAELFDRVRSLPWPELLTADSAFPVSGHCVSSKLASVPDCQSIIKKAVVESMKGKWKTERFAETGPVYRINFNIIRDKAAVYVDTSGEGLHKRGYREASTITPIRETLVSGLVALSGWRPGKALWDPFCGSGTIPIEAAMLAAKRAPGLERGFTAESWNNPAGDQPNTSFRKIFREERDMARETYHDAISRSGGKNACVEIAGSDLSEQCVQSARKNAARAGVSALVRFFQMDSKNMAKNYTRLPELGVKFPERGCVVANPPYGERDRELSAAVETCREWSPALNGFRDWNWCVISALDDLERLIGRTASKRRKLYNGGIKCQAHLYWSDEKVVKSAGDKHNSTPPSFQP